jgi:hypothetical protein
MTLHPLLFFVVEGLGRPSLLRIASLDPFHAQEATLSLLIASR